MTDDAELLRRYATDRSEAAIAELVGRHVDLVYSAAMRQMGGDHHRAKDVTQMVFTDLTRKAAALARHPLLAAWFHRSSYLAAQSLRRREGRRAKYERAAGCEAIHAVAESEAVGWDDIRPVLDEAINQLSEVDRHAILLRFFANRPFGEVGRQLSLTENAARMRVDRALGKLRELLSRRGIKSSTAALAAAMSGRAISAAPAGMATAATSAALAGAGTAGTWIAFMTTSKLPLSLAATVLICGASVATIQDRANRQAAVELAGAAGADATISALEEQNRQLVEGGRRDRTLQDDEASLQVLKAQASELEARTAQAASAMGTVRLTAHTPRVDNGSPVLDVGKLDRQPKALMQVRPEYPAALMEAGVSGEVLVDFVVGSDGNVYNAHTISGDLSTAGSLTSEASPAFASALKDSAVQAVSQWTFQPGQLNGQNVFTHMQVPIVFTPAAGPAPTAASWF